MKKQSSIEWLVEQLDLDIDFNWAIEEAKQMHKQEIIKAYLKGQNEDIAFINEAKDEAEQFYKNTYEKTR